MNESIVPIVDKPIKGVSLMLTCLCDVFYPEVGLATADCLESLGYTVHFDERQTCCGQPAFNSGDRAAARKVALHTLDVFKDAQAIVTSSGSCAAMIRWGYPQLFRGQPEYERVKQVAERTWELSEFLTQVVAVSSWPGSYPKKIALHRSCHLRELSAGTGPEKLLKSVVGLEIVPIETPEQCCGFGGTFSVSFPWTSREMGCSKLDSLIQSEADEVVSSDMGCLLHLNGLMEKEFSEGRLQKKINARHYVEVLRDSMKKD